MTNKMKIERINKLYVGEDCCQVMLPSMDNITIFNKNGLIYHRCDASSFYVNQYLEDDRRYKFPYSSIPEHNKIIFPNKFRFINQLLDYGDDYFVFGSGYGCGMQLNSFKDDNSALFVKKFVDIGNRNEYYKKYDELEDMFRGNDDIKVFNMILDGRIIRDRVIPRKELIEFSVRDILRLDDMYENGFFSVPVNYDLHDININYALLDNPVINVRISNNDITIKKFFIYIVNIDKYRVVEESILVNKFDLDIIKNMDIKTNDTFDPKISRLLNPDIPYENIVREKNKVKKR